MSGVVRNNPTPYTKQTNQTWARFFSVGGIATPSWGERYIAGFSEKFLLRGKNCYTPPASFGRRYGGPWGRVYTPTPMFETNSHVREINKRRNCSCVVLSSFDKITTDIYTLRNAMKRTENDTKTVMVHFEQNVSISAWRPPLFEHFEMNNLFRCAPIWTH
jgi:hypothetical protein